MNMNKTLIILSLYILWGMVSLGQNPTSPRVHLVPTDTSVVDNVSDTSIKTPLFLHRITNFNSSADLSDSMLFFVYDSLRTDEMVTIVTVYETDVDSVVGLWQIGSGSNRALWLNSQRASYDNFAITYRDATEKGVIIHTMLYQYPLIDSTYDGHDTLFIGHEGDNTGQKNFCEMLYFPGRLNYRHQQLLESALAIRYGALLHGPYINSLSDTLWDPLGGDSLYSSGICGIGRDDSLSLQQPQSIIRNDYLTIEALNPFENLTHVMMGHNDGVFAPGEDVVVVDAVQYVALDRQWKLRAHCNGLSELLRMTVAVPMPVDAVRLLVTNGNNVEIYFPVETDGIIFDSIIVNSGQDYFLTLLVNPAALSKGAKGTGGAHGSGEEDDNTTEEFITDFRIMVHPNPTTGHYTAEVSQIRKDNISIQVMDAAGRIVEHLITDEKLAQYKHTGVLNTAGVYYVTLSSNGEQKTVKVIVAK